MKKARHQPDCEECGEPAGIDWKDNPRDSGTWFYTECQRCDSFLCETCAAEGVCATCISQEMNDAKDALKRLGESCR